MNRYTITPKSGDGDPVVVEAARCNHVGDSFEFLDATGGLIKLTDATGKNLETEVIPDAPAELDAQPPVT